MDSVRSLDSKVFESPEILHRARNQSKGIYPIVFLLLEFKKATKENGQNGLFFAAFCYGIVLI